MVFNTIHNCAYLIGTCLNVILFIYLVRDYKMKGICFIPCALYMADSNYLNKFCSMARYDSASIRTSIFGKWGYNKVQKIHFGNNNSRSQGSS